MARKANKSTPNTQKYLDIAEIREDCVVMNDGTLRSVLLVGSVNFALKAEAEQQALISAYMDFINSFEYPFQIVIQSRRLSLEKYLINLKELEKNQKNELLKMQMSAYHDYVRELLDLGQIMTKKFFCVIPYSQYSGKRKSFFTKFKEAFSPGSVIKISKKSFDNYRTELNIRVGQVISHLNSMGLNSRKLDTQGLIELYYNVYNPTTSALQPLENIGTLRVEL